MTDSNTFLNSEGKKEAASYFLSDFPKRRKQKVSCVSLGYTSGSCWRGSAEAKGILCPVRKTQNKSGQCCSDWSEGSEAAVTLIMAL